MKLHVMMFLLYSVTVFCAIVPVQSEECYTYGDNETLSQAKDECIRRAKVKAVESYASYIKSETEIRDFMITKNIIESKSVGMLRHIIIKDSIDKANSTVYIKMTAEIDEDELINSLKNITSDSIENFKDQEKYYFGEGIASTTGEADKIAVDNILIQISEDIDVQNKFADMVDKNDDLTKFTHSVVNSYKSGTSIFEKKIKDETEKTVLRYCKKREIDRLFDSRLIKIENFVENGVKAEYDLRLNDALKNYFWAYALLCSHPNHSALKSKEKYFNNQLMIVALPDKINTILSYLSFKINNVEKKNEMIYVVLEPLYRNQKVHSLDFSFLYGDEMSDPTNSISGLCYVEIPEKEVLKNIIKLNIEHRYEDKSADKEVESVLENVRIPNFKSTFSININNEKYSDSEIKNNNSFKSSVPEIIEKPANNKLDNNSNNNKDEQQYTKKTEISKPVKTSLDSLDSDLSKCREIVCQITKAIESKKYDSVKSCFTECGLNSYTKIIEYGNGKILPNNIELKSIRVNEEMIVRHVPMKFSFPNNKWSTVENIVFTFNKDFKVDALTFALSEMAINDIMNKPTQFAGMSERYQLLQFMENYKTAYCLKDLSYIESIFAENALIIVGRVLKQGEAIGEMYQQLNNSDVEYIQKSKKEYIESLELAFRSNEFINIHFEDNIVKRNNKTENVFGIQIYQEYFSNNYADKGYLFLMMDLTAPKEPQIKVRSWQPQKNPDGSIIGIEDFKL